MVYEAVAAVGGKTITFQVEAGSLIEARKTARATLKGGTVLDVRAAVRSR